MDELLTIYERDIVPKEVPVDLLNSLKELPQKPKKPAKDLKQSMSLADVAAVDAQRQDIPTD